MNRTSQSFHGLEAYSGKNKSIYRLISQAKSLSSLNNGEEICTSDRLIGKIGVVVDGLHTAAFDGDVWSDVVGGGLREVDMSTCARKNVSYFNDLPFDPFRPTPTDKNGVSNSVLRRASESAKGKGRYPEFFVATPHVMCVVVDEKSNERTQKRARVLARALGTVCQRVSSDTPLSAYQVD